MTSDMPTQVEKFVSGELSTNEENDLLIDCEIDERLWRVLALEFVEQRRLAGALNSSQAKRQLLKRSQSRKFQLLTAVCLGLIVGSMGTWLVAGSSLEAVIADTTADADPEVYYIVLDGEDAAATKTAEPEMDENLAGFFAPIFHQAEHEALREAGLQLNDESVLYLISDEQGNQYAMPHRTISVTTIDENADHPSPL